MVHGLEATPLSCCGGNDKIQVQGKKNPLLFSVQNWCITFGRLALLHVLPVQAWRRSVYLAYSAVVRAELKFHE